MIRIKKKKKASILPELINRAEMVSSSLPALPHVKRIEMRNNCLICPFACRCPNHSRLIQKMQA